MGLTSSKLERTIEEEFPEGNFFGFENYGNTCYCNSVLQSLYYCKPFRKEVLQHSIELKDQEEEEESLLSCLVDLFCNIEYHK